MRRIHWQRTPPLPSLKRYAAKSGSHDYDRARRNGGTWPGLRPALQLYGGCYYLLSACPRNSMTEDLTTRVTDVIARTQKIPAESVTIDKTFAELKIDSLDGINIIFAVEEEFGIEVPDEAVREIRSVRDVVKGIEKLLAVRDAAASS